MSITQSVTTIFKSKDQTSEKFNRMGKNAKKFGETSSRAFKKASKSATSFGTITKGILTAGVIQKGLGLVTRGLTSVTAGFLDFDQSITAASAKFSDLNLTTKEGQKTLLALKKTAREVGATTEFSASQAAGGLDFLALAGFKTSQAMALLPGVTNLATVANIDLAQATDIASDSLGAFGLMTKNSEQLAKNFTRVQDVMAKTTATSNTNLVDLFESIKKGAPAFTAAGQSLETFTALAGEMANSGVKGSESGTQLRNVMLRLAKPTKESGDLLNKLGIRTQDAKGNFLDVIDILADFEKGLKGMGTAQKSAALATVFGARSVTGINILLKAGTKQLRSYRQMLIDSKGSAEKMALIMRSSLINRLKSLGSAALEVGFQFFDAFDEQGAGAIDKLTKFVRKIDLTPLINGIKFISSAVSTLFNKVMKFGESTGIFAKLRETIDSLKPVFAGVIDNILFMFNLVKDLGVFEILGDVIGIVADVVTILARALVKMWAIVKPILTKFAELIKPIITALGSVIKFIGKGVSAFKDFTGPKKIILEPTFEDRKGVLKILEEKKTIQIKPQPLIKRRKVIPFQPKQLLEKKTIPVKPKPLLEKKTIPFRKKELTETESFFKKIFDPSGVQKKESLPERIAPNITQLESRRISEFKGKLDISGAPEGSTLKTKSTGPDIIDIELSGASFG